MPGKPNILFIMDDQHRFDFLGLVHSSISTPQLDALARSGTRFTHCCVNAPVCAPSRISLATGKHAWRMGCLDNRCYLPSSVPTYYQRLRNCGYQVASIGKLDLAKPSSFLGREGKRPCNYLWGFTDPLEVEGKMHASRSREPEGPYGFHLQREGLWEAFRDDYSERGRKGWIKGCSHNSVLPEELHSDSWIGQQAVNWIESASRDEPWHLFVSFVGPHDPFDPPATWSNRFKSTSMPNPIGGSLSGKPTWIHKRQLHMTAEEVLETRRQYSANVALIDHWIGRILSMLESRNLTDNTHILFASDHGELLGDHGLFTKSAAYEGALRVPLIMAGPDLPTGKVCHTLVELSDLNPTMCEMAGVPYSKSEVMAMDARSVLPAARDTNHTHRGNTLAQLRNFAALRTETHKLIVNYNDEPELYDLEQDPLEMTNIYLEEPQISEILQRDLLDRMVEGTWNR